MKEALTIEHLTKVYGNGVRAVDDVSFTVPRGDFFGFLGPNGAGKTTTIHCITGIAKFVRGSICVFGSDVVADYNEARRRVGLAPQEYNVDIFATVHEILDWIGGFYGIKKQIRKNRADELIERFDLTLHADKKFKALSGGLKRRVMLARALIHDPDLLILDEPTAGVDVELRHDLWRYFNELNSEGKTIILTSHYIEEVEFLCDRIGIINNGKIVALGKKEEIIKGGKRLEDLYLELTKREKGS